MGALANYEDDHEGERFLNNVAGCVECAGLLEVPQKWWYCWEIGRG
jgi:hypothetical protein